jgi:methyl-accepting chemotaxis protein
VLRIITIQKTVRQIDDVTQSNAAAAEQAAAAAEELAAQSEMMKGSVGHLLQLVGANANDIIPMDDAQFENF